MYPTTISDLKMIISADYSFTSKSGETFTREPGEIAPNDFTINNLENCTVYLLDKIGQITGDNCRNSRLHFGPTERSIYLKDLKNCLITAACRQFRLENCHNLTIFLYCLTEPSIEFSSNITFAPYNFSYPSQDDHFDIAELDPKTNK